MLLEHELAESEYMRSTGASPGLRSRPGQGKVDVEYKLVRARATGTVGVSDFTLDRPRLHLDDLDRAATPAR